MPAIAGNQRSAEGRRAFDDYPTHPDWTRALLQYIEIPKGATVWEPAAGPQQAIVHVLREAGHNVRSTDIQAGQDFLRSTERADVIITNPPFGDVDAFIAHGLRQSDSMLCILLGWHLFSGGIARTRNIWHRDPPSMLVVIPKHMPIAGMGRSQFAHAWAIWDRVNPAEATELYWHLF